MKKVYICSPCRAVTPALMEHNLTQAKEHCRQALASGVIPIAPHVFYTSLLDDTVAEERALGLAIGLELLEICDEVWVFGDPSAGMRAEIERAEALGIPVKVVGL